MIDKIKKHLKLSKILNLSKKSKIEVTHLQKETKSCIPKTSIGKPARSIFIHIPKVAGSSIEKALYGTKGMVGHGTAMEQQLKDPAHFESTFTFAFSRHPLDRFVSAYTYLQHGGRNRFDKEWAEKNLQPYPSFKDFVIALKTDKAHFDTVMSWMHFKPQYNFVCDEKQNIIINFIGKYESLNKDFLYVVKHLNIKAALPHENATKTRTDYQSYYDSETRNIISNIYHIDFECFDYEI